MRIAFFVLPLVLTLGSLAAGQDAAVAPSITLRGGTHIASTEPDTVVTTGPSSYYPPFCPPKTCLYYAGDFESSASCDAGVVSTFDRRATPAACNSCTMPIPEV